MVERSFRKIKSSLEIRPIFHRKQESIRAYVFICALSLLLSRIMEKQTRRTIDSIARDLDVVPIHVEDILLLYCQTSAACQTY